ncbi:hypothetical protein AALP_AA8G269000 [Arabis alpina]|uniref:EF-hand domain-containing protein n=1 Tax=Arabis alpina TaxID=50452 RepID=A0A087G9P2_ARAAL|nr:hypothetical protein AALP_AA8G269000 [Arabis alpina]
MCPSGSTISISLITDFRPAFEVIDADRDGKISSDDLRAFYAGIPRSSSSSSSPGDETMIGTMMSVADANKDGFVEFEEFEKVLEFGRCEQGLMKDVFRAMDKDGDGRLSYGDLKTYLDYAGLPCSDDDIKAMIRFAGGDSIDGVSFDGLLRIIGC